MKTNNIESAVAHLLQWLQASGYSKNTVAFYRGRCNAVLAHAAQENAEFSLESYLGWAGAHTEGRALSVQCCMRRTLAMLDCIISGKPFPQKNVCSASPLKLSCREFAEAAERFSEHLRKRRLEKNTVKFSVYVAKHFLSRMEKCGLASTAEITGRHVADYFKNGTQGFENSTARAMAYRLRQLLKYLHAEKLSGCDLSLCVPTDFAARVKTVTVLPDGAQEALAGWSGEFLSARHARDYAICMLALRLMLRKSDIFRLKLSDIDWSGRKITIVQKKTGQPLTLPLTDDAGNALAAYILDFRPASELPEVFLAADFPVRPIASVSDCPGFVLRLCGYSKKLERDGLHLLRRTGASNLLRSGASMDMISIMLGHQNVSTAGPYLSMDEKRMLLCCGNFEAVKSPEVLK
jgi:site-specific recombinase XerD